MRAPIAPLLLVVCSSLFTSTAFAQHSPAFPTLLRGTPVTLQLDETLNSASARVGQRVAFEVTGDVMQGDRVLIPAGSSALGTVSQVLHHGWVPKFGRSASRLDVNIDTVRLPSGQIVPLSITPDVEDNGRGTTDDSIATSLVPLPATSHQLAAHRKRYADPGRDHTAGLHPARYGRGPADGLRQRLAVPLTDSSPWPLHSKRP